MARMACECPSGKPKPSGSRFNSRPLWLPKVTRYSRYSTAYLLAPDPIATTSTTSLTTPPPPFKIRVP